MAALGAPKEGLVADRRVRKVMCTRRPRWRPATLGAAALSFLLLACSAVLGDRAEDPEGAEVPESVAPPRTYEFSVYALDQMSRQVVPSGTLFQFDESDLPFSIGSVCFGDFREDDTFQATYYGCSGILMNASGTAGAVTIFEGSGKRIVEIQYHGQDPVVVGSEVRYDSYSDMVAWTGTDLIVMDWIDGSWSPRQGIYVEHPADVTFSSARLFVMVFEPSTTLEVPEYPLPALALALILVVLAASGSSGRNPLRRHP